MSDVYDISDTPRHKKRAVQKKPWRLQVWNTVTFAGRPPGWLKGSSYATEKSAREALSCWAKGGGVYGRLGGLSPDMYPKARLLFNGALVEEMARIPDEGSLPFAETRVNLGKAG